MAIRFENFVRLVHQFSLLWYGQNEDRLRRFCIACTVMVAAVRSMRRIKHEIVLLCRIGAKLTIEII